MHGASALVFALLYLYIYIYISTRMPQKVRIKGWDQWIISPIYPIYKDPCMLDFPVSRNHRDFLDFLAISDLELN